MKLLFGVLAGIAFAIAGLQMLTLHSEAGNTVAEVFYNYMGVFSFGMAALSIAGGLPHGALAASRSGTISPAAVIPGTIPIDGWDPTGDRKCPTCQKVVYSDRTTHCNHCGAQLVVPRPTSD